MNKVAELARKLAEEAAKSGIVQLGVVMLQDADGGVHKTEFGFNDGVVTQTVVEETVAVAPAPVEAEVVQPVQ